MMEIEENIRKNALRNAFEHQGKAEIKSVVSKTLGENPALRSRAREIIPIVEREVSRVNSLSIDQIVSEIESSFPDVLQKEKKVQEHRLPDLANVKGKVVMRLAPSPSGPLHIGHSRMAILNDEYVKRYGGELILRLEDTNPANIDPFAYEQIPRDLEWLGVGITKTIIQSSRMEIYYKQALTLLENGHMYVCHCDQEKFRKTRQEGIACPHRESDPAENASRFRKMIDGEYNKGSAVAVMKTDIAHPNPSIRDWIAFRMSAAVHPMIGDKIHLYPTMNFSVAVDDHLLGLTHVIRGTDHISNTEKQSYIFQYNNWKVPEYFHYGFISIPDVIMKTSVIRKGILSGEYRGWDDVKLHTIMAMKRRGYSPETFRRYWIESGLRAQNATFSWEIFNSMNRENVDKDAKRLFFVTDPVKIRITGAKPTVSSIPFHPERKDMGMRKYQIGKDPEIFIPRKEFESVPDGGIIRLKDLYNVIRKGDSFSYSQDQTFSSRQTKIVQWCPENSEDFEVLRPDGTVDRGRIEPLRSEVRGISQFERYGYVNLSDGYGLFLHN